MMSERLDNQINDQEKPKNNSEDVDTLNNLSEEEIKGIYNFLINEGENSTWVNNAVKYYANKKELDDSQRMLLAPANAFENFARFVGSIFTKDGRSGIYEGIKNINELPDTIKNVWFVFYNKLNRKQKLAVGVQLGTESFLVGKVVEKLCNILKIIRRIKLMGLREAGYISKSQINLAKISKDLANGIPKFKPFPKTSPFYRPITSAQKISSAIPAASGIITEKALETTEDMQDFNNARNSKNTIPKT